MTPKQVLQQHLQVTRRKATGIGIRRTTPERDRLKALAIADKLREAIAIAQEIT